MLSFGSEAELVEGVVASIRNAKRRDWKFVLELDATVGVADLVLFRRNERTAHALKGLAKIDPRLAAILDPRVAKNISGFDQFCDLIGSSASTARRHLRVLQSVDFAVVQSKQLFVKPIVVPPISEIVAIEAKLRNWQSALSQAYRNRQFADQSWVVLDHAHCSPAIKAIEKFELAGVGLVSAARDGCLFVHSLAANNMDFSMQKRWAAQAALARRLCE